MLFFTSMKRFEIAFFGVGLLIPAWAVIRARIRVPQTNRCRATSPSEETSGCHPLTLWETETGISTQAAQQHVPAKMPFVGLSAKPPETADARTNGTAHGAPASHLCSTKESNCRQQASESLCKLSPNAETLLRQYRLDQLGMDQAEIARLLASGPDGAVTLDLAINRRRWLEDRLGPLVVSF